MVRKWATYAAGAEEGGDERSGVRRRFSSPHIIRPRYRPGKTSARTLAQAASLSRWLADGGEDSADRRIGDHCSSVSAWRSATPPRAPSTCGSSTTRLTRSGLRTARRHIASSGASLSGSGQARQPAPLLLRFGRCRESRSGRSNLPPRPPSWLPDTQVQEALSRAASTGFDGISLLTVGGHSRTLAHFSGCSPRRALNLEPAASDDLRMPARRTSRYWPFVALVAAFAVCASNAEALGRSAAAAPATSVRITALILTVPRGFDQHEVQRGGRLVGVLVTDYPVRANSPTLTEGVFPSHGVVLLLGRAVGVPLLARRISAPLLRLPVSLTQLEGPQHHADGTAWNGTLRFRGLLYTISFWVGRSATSRDRATLLHTLALVRGTP